MNGQPHQCSKNPYNSTNQQKTQQQQQTQYGSVVTGGAANLTAAETRSPKQFEGVVEDRSLETNTIIPSSQFDKEEYFRLKEQKYDQNIIEYKAHQFRLEELLKNAYLAQQETLNIMKDIRDIINNYLHPNPSIQKASELSNNIKHSSAITNEYTKALLTEKQNEAWDELHDTIEDLGLSEDRPDEENEDENPERQRGYPE